MRKHAALAVVALVSVAVAAHALKSRSRVLCEGFLPVNSMRIPVGDVRAAGIAEAQFNATLDRVQEVYGPIIAARGGQLDIQRLWDDATVNASAIQNGKTWTINMYGGLARHAAVNADGFALVACHELGHHLGGFPKIAGDDWATNEGGADYFATLKCLRRVLPAKNPSSVDKVAKAGCDGVYKSASDRAACARGTMAGVSVSSLLAELGGDKKPQLDTPDASEVATTDDSHPAAQCRLDTYFQAAMCAKKVDEDQTAGEPATGACTKTQGFAVGLRPKCWYKPAVGAESTDAVARLNLTSPKALQERLDSLRGALSGRGI